MSYNCSLYKLVEKKALAKDIYSFLINCPQVASRTVCGQFVHIRVPGFTLRRPISVCEVDRQAGTLRIVFMVKGEGTKALSKLNEGDDIDMIAPLGNGFSSVEPAEGKRVIVVGGGIGVPPMLETARRHISKGHEVAAVLGFRSYPQIILIDEFVGMGVRTIVCTDDGSFGLKGTIADPLKAELEKDDVSAVFACGPVPMLKTIASITAEYDVFCEISLEERMGCGVGACVGCVARIERGGEEKLLRVCKEGPVFNASEVIF